MKRCAAAFLASAYLVLGTGSHAAAAAPTPMGAHIQVQSTPLALDRVSCPSTTRCVSVGSGGTAAVSTDGGHLWTMVTTGTKQLLFGVDCPDATHCWAVGENGTIIASTDGGSTWTLQKSGTIQFLYAITCPTASQCWAGGEEETILMTADSGTTWSPQQAAAPGTTAASLGYISDLACPTTSDCIAVDDAGILVTGDAGAHWIVASGYPAAGFGGVSCAPGTTDCWAVGSGGVIVTSSDGGGTWHVQQASGTAAAFYLLYGATLWGISCPGGGVCVTVGSQGIAEYTKDGGTTWSPSTLPVPEAYIGIACTTSVACSATGYNAHAAVSGDGGATWSGTLAPPSTSQPRVPVMIVGDSVAFTLDFGLDALSDYYGIQISNASLLGCGVTQGSPVVLSGQSTEAFTSCNGDLTPTNPQLPQIWAKDLQTYAPRVVLLLAGRWEVADRAHQGAMANITQPAYAAYVESQLRLAASILTSTGAHLVLATSPYFSEPGPVGGGTWDQDNPARIDDYNALVDRVAGQFPGRVSVVDLNSKVDPSGSYAQEIGGVEVRESDGVHFELSGGQWLAPWLEPQLAASAPSTLQPPGGYWSTDAEGNVYEQGTAAPLGGLAGSPPSSPVVGMAATPDGSGYWLVASDGGIFTFGDAAFFGSTGGMRLVRPVVGMAATPDGGGYWLVASDGGIFTFGDAAFFGSTGGMPLARPVVGMAATPDGGGYWLVASDGGIFTFGDAGFFGSTGGLPLAAGVVSMAPDPSTGGYWLLGSDGGIFSFGPAGTTPFLGAGGLSRPAVGLAETAGGQGYVLVSSAGEAAAYGVAPAGAGAQSGGSVPIAAVATTL